MAVLILCQRAARGAQGQHQYKVLHQTSSHRDSLFHVPITRALNLSIDSRHFVTILGIVNGSCPRQVDDGSSTDRHLGVLFAGFLASEYFEYDRFYPVGQSAKEIGV